MIESIRVPSLYRYLNAAIPDWEQYEVETLLSELKVSYSELLVDKIEVARIFKVKPTLFYEDLIFFLHACDVINDNVADFGFVPHINSLEAAKGIIEAFMLLGGTEDTLNNSHPFSEGVRETIKVILIDDGYSYPVWPFDVVGITGLTPGAWEIDMKNKAEAIRKYVNGSTSKSTD